ncbi:MAG: hypothetical protein AB8B79_12435 [Granulosicoccus sp.]
MKSYPVDPDKLVLGLSTRAASVDMNTARPDPMADDRPAETSHASSHPDTLFSSHI